MKALSVTRPWSTLILRGKDIENRTWTTSFRGTFLLHAAQSWSKEATAWAQWAELRDDRFTLGDFSWRPADHATGIVGLADLVDVCSSELTSNDRALPCDCGVWAMPGQYHWRLANVRPLPEPVPARGALGLWTPTVEVAEAVRRQLAAVAA